MNMRSGSTSSLSTIYIIDNWNTYTPSYHIARLKIWILINEIFGVLRDSLDDISEDDLRDFRPFRLDIMGSYDIIGMKFGDSRVSRVYKIFNKGVIF
jgi:hypothetical protein